MRRVKKIMIAFIVLIIVLTSMTPMSVAAKECELEDEVIEYQGESIRIETIYLESSVVVKGKSSDGSMSIFTYDKESGLATLDGQQVTLEFSSEKEICSQNNEGVSKVVNPYTPVYVNTYNIKLSAMVKTVNEIATYLGGTIAAAKLIGIRLPSIADKISDWCSVISFATATGGSLLTGTFSYKLYKTSGPVQFGVAAWAQTAYRYQNCSVTLKLLDKTMYHTYSNIGDWWYASKPY